MTPCPRGVDLSPGASYSAARKRCRDSGQVAASGRRLLPFTFGERSRNKGTKVMEERDWIDYFQIVANVFTPILIALLGIVVWRYRISMERKIKLEEKLVDEKMEIYYQVLEPYIVLWSPGVSWNSRDDRETNLHVARKALLSPEHVKSTFKLSLIGSDGVVLAFRELRKHLFGMKLDSREPNEADVKVALELLGNLILEIRKNMGNRATAIDGWGMIEGLVFEASRIQTKGSRL